MTDIRATYRLQLNKDFTFADAAALLPYLDELGISHLYLSPILKARPGSTHGYDTVDHTQINPELGTLDAFRALASAVAERGMGIIVDFVPNHMGVGGADNALWLDVLRHGADSHYADWFDIDWHPARPGMDGKLLVPFLGTSYAEALAGGALELRADGDGLAVWAYGSEKLPIRPEDNAALLARHGSIEAAIASHAGTAGQAASWAALDGLIARQHWRLAHFAVAADEINYRRFFINNDLAGLRIDRPDVFAHAHALIFSLIEEGLVTGLRIDHVDGLLDPKGYLKTLREKAPRPIYLVVEKILAPHESIRTDWPVDGTTGYEVGAELTRLLMHADGEADVSNAYADFLGTTPVEPEAEAYACKLRVMDNELAVELVELAKRFAAIAWSAAATADLTEAEMRRALRETIAQLSVYRTYVDDDGIAAEDRQEIGRAIALARQNLRHLRPAAFDFVEALLCGTLGADYDPRAVVRAVGKFQQYTGPAMAKGLEDTALYRSNRLVALNEVGAHAERYAVTIAEFHDSNRARLARHPRCMLATSTHDTKRGEDTRAVIAAIGDDPARWTAAVETWRELLVPAGGDAIHPNDLYLFFQLLLGGWPLFGTPEDLAERLKGAMMKSLREARQRSDWGVPDNAYESAMDKFIDAALGNPEFLAAFGADRLPFAAIGQRKGLIQAALKLTIPGMPDIYRGAEDWEQSFMDPDNRRELDFAGLAARLAAPQPGRDDKLILIRQLLQFRRSQPELFASGSYEPITRGDDMLAFRRQWSGHEVVVLADVSRGHDRGLEAATDLPTIAGSAKGPVWIMGA